MVLTFSGLILVLIPVSIAYFGIYKSASQSASFPSRPLARLMREELPRLDENVEEKPAPGPNVITLSTPTPTAIQKGKLLFSVICVSCHGPEAKGDGIAARVLQKKPRDYNELTGWRFGPKVSQIFRTLTKGIPDSAHASYEGLPVEDRFALVHFIRSLNSRFPKDTPGELAALATEYHFSHPKRGPSQIPVQKAMESLIMENTRQAKRIADLTRKLDTDKPVILRHVVADGERLITALLATKQWQKDETALIRFFTTDPIQKGLKPAVVGLRNEEWREIDRYLKTALFAQPK